VDAYGDPLPAGAVARLGTTRLRLRGLKEILGFSADGKTLLALRQSDLSLLDLATGRTVRAIALPAHNGQPADPRDLRFFANVPVAGDGRTVALGGHPEGGLFVVDIPSGKVRSRLAQEVLFPQVDGVETGYARRPGQLSHDGKFLAMLRRRSDGQTEVAWFDTVRAKQVHRASVKWSHDEVSSLSFTQDGKILAFAEPSPKVGRSRLRQWDTASGKELRSPNLSDQVRVFRFLPDSKAFVATLQYDLSVRLLETASGKEVRRFSENEGGSPAFALSADGKTLALAGMGRVRLWDLRLGKEVRSVRHPALDGNAPGVFLSPDGKTLAAVTPHRLLLWDVATGKELYPTGGHAAPVSSVAFAPGGKRLASVASDGTLRVWELPSGKEDDRFRPFAKVDEEEPGQGEVAARSRVGFSPDGSTVLATMANLPVQTWDARTARPLRQFGNGKAVYPTQLSPDGRLLAGAVEDGPVRLWDTRTGKEVLRMRWHNPPAEPEEAIEDSLFGLVFSPDGKTLASMSLTAQAQKNDVLLRLWEVSTGTERLRLRVDSNPGGPERIQGVRLAVLRRHFEQGVGDKGALAFAPDGKTLALGVDNEIYLHDAATGKELRQFAGAGVWAAALAFSADGKLLAAGRHDGGIRLWRADTGALWCDVPGHEHPVTALAFSPDGKTLASGSVDSTVLLWDVTQFPPGRRAPARGLTAAELEALWADLAGADAARAYRAAGALAAEPGQAVPLLKARLRPVAPPEPERVARLLTELESKRFTVRQRAAHELEGLGDLAEPALEKLLAAKPPLETRKRVEAILERLRGPAGPGDMLRALRAVEVLERIGSPPARAVLRALAGGAPGHRITEEARASLARLSR
jgi:WD40 repeat protein